MGLNVAASRLSRAHGDGKQKSEPTPNFRPRRAFGKVARQSIEPFAAHLQARRSPADRVNASRCRIFVSMPTCVSVPSRLTHPRRRLCGHAVKGASSHASLCGWLRGGPSHASHAEVQAAARQARASCAPPSCARAGAKCYIITVTRRRRAVLKKGRRRSRPPCPRPSQPHPRPRPTRPRQRRRRSPRCPRRCPRRHPPSARTPRANPRRTPR